MKPASISCPCQRAGGSGPSGSPVPCSATTQSAMTSTAQRPASRKNGRSPCRNRAGPAGRAAGCGTKVVLMRRLSSVMRMSMAGWPGRCGCPEQAITITSGRWPSSKRP